MAPKIERLVEGHLLGEGPHWDVPSQTLYYVDILKKDLHRYVPSTKEHTKVAVDAEPSIIIPVEGKKDQFVITLKHKVAIINWDGKSDKITIVKVIASVDEQYKNNRINDAKCDALGRLWGGTLDLVDKDVSDAPEVGTLYSFGPSGVLGEHLDKIRISNGLAWNADNTKVFYIDSLKGGVQQFDFDLEKGTISNGKMFFTLEKHNIPGIPDGQAIDADGNLWVAVFGGNRVIKIDGTKPETLLDTIILPAKQITSVVWGGKNLDELYVTSGSFPNEGETFDTPDHGALFRVTGIGAKGLPGVNFKF